MTDQIVEQSTASSEQPTDQPCCKHSLVRPVVYSILALVAAGNIVAFAAPEVADSIVSAIPSDLMAQVMPEDESPMAAACVLEREHCCCHSDGCELDLALEDDAEESGEQDAEPTL